VGLGMAAPFLELEPSFGRFEHAHPSKHGAAM
jgi:hypothetical protein